MLLTNYSKAEHTRIVLSTIAEIAKQNPKLNYSKVLASKKTAYYRTMFKKRCFLSNKTNKTKDYPISKFTLRLMTTKTHLTGVYKAVW
jgi:hypothetical protein